MRLSFFIIVTLCSQCSFGQLAFSITPVPAIADSTAEAESLVAHAILKNNTDTTIVIAWQRINNDLPENWQSYICSNITCATPDISMGTFSLTAHDSTNLDCYFQPYHISGSAIVDLKLFLTNDTTQMILARYLAFASPVSTFEPYLEIIKTFPNPVSDYIHVQHTQLAYIKIFNHIGRSVPVKFESNRIDVSSLTNGHYLLHIFDQRRQLLSINRFLVFQAK